MANNTSQLGYLEEPPNGYGISRSRTTQQLRSWLIPRTQEALEAFNTEIGKIEYPGIYLLLDRNKVYIGEAKNLYKRLKTHMTRPEDKIKKWERALLMSDGRSATQSDFNDAVVRKALEYYLISLFTANRYHVICQGEDQQPTSQQKLTIDNLINELNFFLRRKGLIQKLIEKKGQQEVFPDQIRKMLLIKKKKIQSWSAHEAIVDGEKVFMRPGSHKRKGWQITFRGRSPDSFIDCLKKGKGYLLFRRGPAFLVPLREVQKVISDTSAYKQDTIDIWIKFEDDKTSLSYKDRSIDITRYSLL
jgi:hypothetical protein